MLTISIVEEYLLHVVLLKAKQNAIHLPLSIENGTYIINIKKIIETILLPNFL